MWKFGGVRISRPDSAGWWCNVDMPSGVLWQFAIRRWAWKRGPWPSAAHPVFHFWLVGWLEIRRYEADD